MTTPSEVGSNFAANGNSEAELRDYLKAKNHSDEEITTAVKTYNTSLGKSEASMDIAKKIWEDIQSLVEKVCPMCKGSGKVDADKDDDKKECTECSGSGYMKGE